MEARYAFLILCAAAMSGCPDVAQITAADPQDPAAGGVLEIRYKGRDSQPEPPRSLSYPQVGNKF